MYMWHTCDQHATHLPICDQLLLHCTVVNRSVCRLCNGITGLQKENLGQET